MSAAVDPGHGDHVRGIRSIRSRTPSSVELVAHIGEELPVPTKCSLTIEHRQQQRLQRLAALPRLLYENLAYVVGNVADR
jgi:hypothetical protein